MSAPAKRGSRPRWWEPHDCNRCAIPAAQQESDTNCRKAEWRRQEIAWVGIPFRITNPRAPVRQDLSRIGPQGSSVLHTLGEYFPECYKRCLGVGSLLLLRRWHIFLRAGVSSVRRCRTSALRLVSSVLCSSLWATRSDASFPSSGGLGRGFDGLVPGSPSTAIELAT
jgi:hypothetical protein